MYKRANIVGLFKAAGAMDKIKDALKNNAYIIGGTALGTAGGALLGSNIADDESLPEDERNRRKWLGRVLGGIVGAAGGSVGGNYILNMANSNSALTDLNKKLVANNNDLASGGKKLLEENARLAGINEGSIADMNLIATAFLNLSNANAADQSLALLLVNRYLAAKEAVKAVKPNPYGVTSNGVQKAEEKAALNDLLGWVATYANGGQ